MKYLTIILSAMSLSACTTNHDTAIIDKPTHCPMHYQPVCATLKQDGKTFQKTFGNHCSAQNFIPNDTHVVSIVDGACHQEALQKHHTNP